MTACEETKKVVIVGALALDDVRIHDYFSKDAHDRKITAKYAYRALGGGGGNVALTLKALEKHLGYPADVTLFTKIGKEEGDYGIRNSVYKTLNNSGIHTQDMVGNQSYRVPNNIIFAYKDGRNISKDPLSGTFNDRAKMLDHGVSDQLKAAIDDADLVILQSNYPEVAQMAAKYARDLNVPVMLDYSASTPEEGAKFNQTLWDCNYILAPGEAKLAGMSKESDGDNAQRLFEKLRLDYPHVPLISVSDGGKPVMICLGGEEQPLMKIPPIKNNVDQLGTGDTRCAAFVYYLLQGDDPLLALKKSSVIASFSIQYPGREWLPHLKAHLDNHRLFQNNFGVSGLALTHP